MTDNIRSTIKEKISAVLTIPSETVTDHLELSRVGLDSMKTVILVVELEEMFDITFADHELLYEYFSTLDKIISLVSEKLAAK